MAVKASSLDREVQPPDVAPDEIKRVVAVDLKQPSPPFGLVLRAND